MLELLNNLYNNHQHEFCISLATLVGAIIGLERELRGKSAGIRTYAIVAMASCLFTIVSRMAGLPNDTTRIAAQIVSGIGFIGAGVIWHKDGGIVEGLTTAASMWGVSAIGMAIGFGFVSLALISSIVVLVIMELLGLVARIIMKILNRKMER